MSMEEEAARQAATNAATNQPAASSSAPAPATSAPVPASATEPAPATDDEEEAMLQQALALSEAREGEHGGDVEMGEGGEGDEELTEEDMIARAIEMSMQGEEEGNK